jgi:hypothetical protein
MITGADVRGLVAQVLAQICITPQYDLIETMQIQDVDGLSVKFWVRQRDRTMAEGQCYYDDIDDDSWQFLWVYRISFPRRAPVAESYEAWFANGRLVQLYCLETTRSPSLLVAA